LGRELLYLAFCWRLERRDGVTVGLTSHDRDLGIGGVLYRAAPGMVPSAVTRAGGVQDEAMDVRGALTHAAIDEDDLEDGRWDGAGVSLHLTEWSDPGVLWLELARGELGEIERQGGSFSAELRGALSLLDRAVVPETSPCCRARLGDAACGINLAAHRRLARVESVVGAAVRIEGGGLGSGLYAFGRLRCLTGALAGLGADILAHDGAVLTLADAPRVPPPPGVLVQLDEGCDGRIETCAERFANAANFRGEPYLPGNDLLTRYPGGNG
jgi:uncharacterized phage protein (TIGR02218 family)